MKDITRALCASLMLAAGQHAPAQEPSVVVIDLRSPTVLAVTAPGGKPSPIAKGEVKLPARIVSIDPSRIAEVVDAAGRRFWLPLRDLVTAGGASGKVGPCTGDQTRGVRGVRPC